MDCLFWGKGEEGIKKARRPPNEFPLKKKKTKKYIIKKEKKK